MKVFVPDSVADEVHERDIADHYLIGLRPMVACLVADAIESGNIETDDAMLMEPYDIEKFTNTDGVWSLVRHDGTGHRYGIVICTDDPTKAKEKAESVLAEWNSNDNDE